MFAGLQKLDLYRTHDMTRDFDGGCYSIDLRKESINLENDKEIYQLLDAACTLGGLYPISDGWRKLTYEEGKTMLSWGFQNDLAYGGGRLGKKKTNKYMKLVLDQINSNECLCFTNWADDPWGEGGRSWSGISKNTFDLGVVFLDKESLVMMWLASED